MRMYLFILTISIALISDRSFAQTITKNVQVLASTNNQLEASIAINPTNRNNIIIAAIKEDPSVGGASVWCCLRWNPPGIPPSIEGGTEGGSVASPPQADLRMTAVPPIPR